MLGKVLNAVEVVTFDYPYMFGGKRKAPPKAEKLVEFHSDVVKEAVAKYPGHPLILVGKSMGSRVLSMSPDARMARIGFLENMLNISSNVLMAMASQLLEAEEMEHSLAGRGRWNHLRSMGDAKNLLQHMFNTTVEAR